MKPLLIYVELMRTKVENHDNITSIKNNEIEGLQMKISQYESDLIKNLREQIIAGLREQIIKKDSELKQQKFDQQNVYETIIQELRNYKNITKNIDQKNQEISKFQGQINSEAVKSREFQKQLEEQKKNIDQKNQEISKFHQQLEEHKKSIEEKNQKISKLQNDVNKSDVKLEDLKEINCTSFGDAPCVHKISFSHYSFDVLCDSETAGPGWIVIQQRINGKEDFNRSWTTYREGFGSFDGNFFLGLDKVHRLTSYKPHEFYIHLENFEGEIEYARYKQFEIAGESDEYKLSFSEFSGYIYKYSSTVDTIETIPIYLSVYYDSVKYDFMLLRNK
ncbi:fibroleukin-like [Drosophila grimshawi]|uniref:fibroleukin-like n=1 Tax=Drosophila grimshawi TaxID=7222 RepID=UPI001C936B31|nr:fibroleukin-like [Drosophila grimshawi]